MSIWINFKDKCFHEKRTASCVLLIAVLVLGLPLNLALGDRGELAAEDSAPVKVQKQVSKLAPSDSPEKHVATTEVNAKTSPEQPAVDKVVHDAPRKSIEGENAEACVGFLNEPSDSIQKVAYLDMIKEKAEDLDLRAASYDSVRDVKAYHEYAARKDAFSIVLQANVNEWVQKACVEKDAKAAGASK